MVFGLKLDMTATQINVTRIRLRLLKLEILIQAKFDPSKHIRYPPGTIIDGKNVGGKFAPKGVASGSSSSSKKNKAVKSDFSSSKVSDFSDLEIEDKGAKDLARQLSFKTDTQEKILECLAKRVAYLKPDDRKSDEYKVVERFLSDRDLEIKETLTNKETGLNAFLIGSKDGSKQAIVFTGSNDLQDWKSNIAGEEVGRSQFESDRKGIEKMIEKATEGGGKAVVSGHSLGGALAQILTAEYPDKVAETMVFNSASISIGTAKKYQKSDNPPKVSLVYNENDLVPVLKGTAILPGTLSMYRHQDISQEDNPIDAHMNLMSDPRNSYKKVSLKESRSIRKSSGKLHPTNHERLHTLHKRAAIFGMVNVN